MGKHKKKMKKGVVPMGGLYQVDATPKIIKIMQMIARIDSTKATPINLQIIKAVGNNFQKVNTMFGIVRYSIVVYQRN